MKKSSLLILASVMPMAIQAQMAAWTIPPKYDNMEMVVDDAILLTDSAGVATVWSKEGQRLFSTEDHVNAYAEDKAVISQPSGKITGYIDRRGRFTKLPESTIAYDYPCFSDGYLCVQSGRGYGYLQAGSDQSDFLFFDRAYPFFQGYASYMSYKQPEKKKDIYFNYHSTPDKKVIYEIGGKKFEFRDIQFLSSVAPDGRAIAVIKGKVFWFDAATGTFSPMYGGGVEDKKNQVTVEDKTLETALLSGDKNIHFFGRYGKNNPVEFTFDPMLRPETVVIDDRAIRFPAANAEPYTYKSPLTIVTENGKKGLNHNGQKLIPAQFDDISLVYDDYALANFKGKWGLLKALPEVQYTFEVNNGKDIGFRHETFETQVRLDLPKEISSNDIDFDVKPNSGVKLDKRFMDAKDTRAGNYLQYNCVLTIPENLPATLTTITYPVEVVYNGLKFYEYPLTVKGWHLKSYNVNIDDDELAVKDGRATLTVDIVADRKPGEPDYPFVVQARSDRPITSEKISETRYTYMVDDLQDGVNKIEIIVTEKGCPSAVFPVEINYAKPSKRGKEQIEVKKAEDMGESTSTSAVPVNMDNGSATQSTPAATPSPRPAYQGEDSYDNSLSSDGYPPIQKPVQTPVAVPANQPAQQPVAVPNNNQQPAPIPMPQGGTSVERYIPSAPVPAEQVPSASQDAANDSIKNANLLRFLEN